mgnify:CR=1 FL=1
MSPYYIDDRTGLAGRGSCIVFDKKTGVIGKALSTKSKIDPAFGRTIEEIRDHGFKPDQQLHVSRFDLAHEDSFHTVQDGALHGVS